jgi:uncharacterized protein (DUF433 family)
MSNILDRITINPDICHGQPVIRGMRYPVELLLDLLAAGMSFSEILQDYPALEEDDIRASLLYASRLTKIKTMHRIGA